MSYRLGLTLVLTLQGCSTFPQTDLCVYEKSKAVRASEQPYFDEVTRDHVGRYRIRPVWFPKWGNVPEPGVIDELYFEFSLPERRAVERLSSATGASRQWCPEERELIALHVDVRGQDGRFVGATDVPITYREDNTMARDYVRGSVPIRDYPEHWNNLVSDLDRDWELDLDRERKLQGVSLTTIIPTTFRGLVDEPTSNSFVVAVNLHHEITTTLPDSGEELVVETSGALFEGAVTHLEPLPPPESP